MSEKPRKSTFLDRLIAALAPHLGGEVRSPTKVGKFIGVNKQTAARWLEGGAPSPDMLYLIADKARVNPRWLALDEGPREMLEPEFTVSEVEVITEIYRALHQRNPKALLKWLRDGRELVEITKVQQP